MRIGPRRRSTAQPQAQQRDTGFLWWMPLAGIVLSVGWAAWETIDESGDSLSAFAQALIWPGLAIFLATTFVVWLAWKVDLE